MQSWSIAGLLIEGLILPRELVTSTQFWLTAEGHIVQAQINLLPALYATQTAFYENCD